MTEAIDQFRIRVDDSVLEDLRDRLARTRFPDEIAGTGWEYGIPSDYLRELVEYWRDEYDWRAQEARLNELEHFRTSVDGQSIHFVHARSPHADAFPLLLTHGWPGSIVEFLDVIPRLTDPEVHDGRAADAFHVIAPSLPGYGFSELTRTRGWDVRRVAEAFVELMRRLGYTRYGAQGGDWGAQVATRIGALDPAHCAAIHLNMPIADRPDDPAPLTEEEKADLAAMQHFQREESGYAIEQGTKPQTLGVSLNDSPAGLLAWIVEKFRTLERLRRPPRELLRPRSTRHERDVVLGHADDHVFGAAVPGDEDQRGGAAVRRRSHRRRAVSQGGAALPALLGRAALQRDALGRHATRWPLRGDGAARAVHGRRSGLLPDGARNRPGNRLTGAGLPSRQYWCHCAVARILRGAERALFSPP